MMIALNPYLKEVLINATVIKPPICETPFDLTCEASELDVGAIRSSYTFRKILVTK
jgi:hypothetical protein